MINGTIGGTGDFGMLPHVLAFAHQTDADPILCSQYLNWNLEAKKSSYRYLGLLPKHTNLQLKTEGSGTLPAIAEYQSFDEVSVGMP